MHKHFGTSARNSLDARLSRRRLMTSRRVSSIGFGTILRTSRLEWWILQHNIPHWIPNIPRPLTQSTLGWMTSSERVYHPRRLMRLLPRRPRRLMALQCQRRRMWSQPRPHQGRGEWNWGAPRMCLDPITRPGARVLIPFVKRTDPICLGLRTSGIREA
jgi:hypothetical protein